MTIPPAEFVERFARDGYYIPPPAVSALAERPRLPTDDKMRTAHHRTLGTPCS